MEREFQTYPDAKAFDGGDQNNVLTKREYYAGLAMQGLIASTLNNCDLTPEAYEAIPQLAVENADALIAALNQEAR